MPGGLEAPRLCSHSNIKRLLCIYGQAELQILLLRCGGGASCSQGLNNAHERDWRR